LERRPEVERPGQRLTGFEERGQLPHLSGVAVRRFHPLRCRIRRHVGGYLSCSRTFALLFSKSDSKQLTESVQRTEEFRRVHGPGKLPSLQNCRAAKVWRQCCGSWDLRRPRPPSRPQCRPCRLSGIEASWSRVPSRDERLTTAAGESSAVASLAASRSALRTSSSTARPARMARSVSSVSWLVRQTFWFIAASACNLTPSSCSITCSISCASHSAGCGDAPILTKGA